MLGNTWVVRLEMSCKIIDSTALTCSMSDEHDLVGRREQLRDILIELNLLWNAFPFVVGLFTMDQMMMEPVRIIGVDCLLEIWMLIFAMLVHMRRMMVYDNNHARRLSERLGRGGGRSLPQKMTETRHLFRAKFMLGSR